MNYQHDFTEDIADSVAPSHGKDIHLQRVVFVVEKRRTSWLGEKPVDLN